MPHKKGFTLIELIIVFAIIGVLLMIILPQLSLFKQKGKNTARIEYIKTSGYCSSILLQQIRELSWAWFSY
jgi:prepilin-type N-terminal cleavage/methylation domain-containing protein